MSKLLAKLKGEAKRFTEEQEEKSSGKYEKVDWFQASIGDNTIRILPHWSEPEDKFFFVQKTIHFLPKKLNSGKIVSVPVPCMEMQDKTCIACEAYTELKAQDSSDADTFRPVKRFLYNVIDYGIVNGVRKGSPAVKVYAAPVSVHTDVMIYVEELDEAFWSVDNGRDWKIKKTVDASKGVKFGTSYKTYPSMKASSVPEKCVDLLKDMVDLDGVWNEEPEQIMREVAEKAGVSKTKAKAKAKAKDEDEDEVVDDGFEDVAAGVFEPAEKKSRVSGAVKKKATKAKVTKAKVEDDDDDLGVDTGGDDEIENELRSLGI